MSLLSVLLLLAQEGLPPVPPRMPVEDEPSAFACTFERALGANSCTYEAQSAAGDSRDNSAAAAEAGVAQCARVAAERADLRKSCEHAVAEASLSAPCAIAARLGDTNGHLTREAAGCVGALRDILWRTFFAAVNDRAFDDPSLDSKTAAPASGPPSPPAKKAPPADPKRPAKI
ncbi:MAG TPA: hypothetical protein VLW85_04790 [Myxococcales bacterium]|nr:hypothetical protein [Myxococcales bacterium]